MTVWGHLSFVIRGSVSLQCFTVHWNTTLFSTCNLFKQNITSIFIIWQTVCKNQSGNDQSITIAWISLSAESSESLVPASVLLPNVNICLFSSFPRWCSIEYHWMFRLLVERGSLKGSGCTAVSIFALLTAIGPSTNKMTFPDGTGQSLSVVPSILHWLNVKRWDNKLKACNEEFFVFLTQIG